MEPSTHSKEHKEIISEYWAADERAKQAVADGSHLPTFLPFTLGAGSLKVYIQLFLSVRFENSVLIIQVSICIAFYDPEKQNAC